MSNLPKDVQRKLDKLSALEAGGVDNWEWYGESLKEWFAENEVDELLEGFIENLNDIMADAEVDEPAGCGCGYAIKFDEDEVINFALELCKKYLEIQNSK